MKKRFNSNQIETCGIVSNLPKKEQIINIKHNIAGHKTTIKKANKYMKTLKSMSSNYDFHQESMNTLVGNTYILIDRTKGYLDMEEAKLVRLLKED